MARKLGGPLDFGQNEARNLRLHNLASDPGSPVEGQVWWNTTSKLARVFNGTSTVALAVSGAIADADIAAGAGIAISKLAVDPRARSSHTGTQLAATISDFDAQVRTSRLDQMAAPTAAVSFGSQRATNQADPTSAQDSATKAYVDALIQSLRKMSVRAATTANITLSGTQTIDTVAVVAGDRVLVKNQTAPAQNGVYIAAAGAWTRATDMDTAGEVDGALVIIEDGGLAGTAWVTTSEVTTLGTDSIDWTQFATGASYTGGAGLTLSGVDFSVNVDGSTLEINADTLRVKDAGISLSGTKVTGTLPVASGGTGQTTAKAARETGLGAAGRYDNASTHGAVSAGGTIVIAQTTHLLRSTRALIVQTQDASTGDLRLDDTNVAANGDVTITFAQAQAANSILVTIVG